MTSFSIYMPDFWAFMEEMALPAAEVGPVESCAFCWLAAICDGVVIGSLLSPLVADEPGLPCPFRFWDSPQQTENKIIVPPKERWICWDWGIQSTAEP